LISTTLIAGGSAKQREEAIRDLLDPGVPTAVLFEGMPSGTSSLPDTPRLTVAYIAPGCPCCTGSLVFRVTLNRILRTKLDHLYIAVATAEHLQTLRAFLALPPYSQSLSVVNDVILRCRT